MFASLFSPGVTDFGRHEQVLELLGQSMFSTWALADLDRHEIGPEVAWRAASAPHASHLCDLRAIKTKASPLHFYANSYAQSGNKCIVTPIACVHASSVH